MTHVVNNIAYVVHNIIYVEHNIAYVVNNIINIRRTEHYMYMRECSSKSHLNPRNIDRCVIHNEQLRLAERNKTLPDGDTNEVSICAVNG